MSLSKLAGARRERSQAQATDVPLPSPDHEWASREFRNVTGQVADALLSLFHYADCLDKFKNNASLITAFCKFNKLQRSWKQVKSNLEKRKEKFRLVFLGRCGLGDFSAPPLVGPRPCLLASLPQQTLPSSGPSRLGATTTEQRAQLLPRRRALSSQTQMHQARFALRGRRG
jgi:hypothetical protein